MVIKSFIGGLAQTNAFALEVEGDWWLIDAPEGTCEFLDEEGFEPEVLVLTHGHWDHIWEAARVVEKTGCRVIGHREDEELFSHPNIMKNYGLPVDLDPVRIDSFVSEGETHALRGVEFEVSHVPGHCPGSIALYSSEAGVLIGGDVLFAGGIGRWDLPGGDREVLMRSIQKHFLPLPDETRVLPGHGPVTTIGQEKQTNPFLNRAMF